MARGLTRAPALTAAILAAVTLATGAGTTIASVVDAGWLRPLPFDDASSLVSLWLERHGEGMGERIPLTGGDLVDLRSEPGLFAAVSGWQPVDPVVSDVLGSELLPAAAVTEGMFARVLRVHPLLGRTFVAEEDVPGGPPTVILSHRLWTERFGGDPGAIGRSLVLDGTAHVVVGIMPSGFHPPFRPEALAWIPARLSTERCRSGCRTVTALARLAPGTTLPVARDRASALSARLAESHPDTHAGLIAAMAELGRDRSRLSAGSVRALLLTGVLVLLIAAVNVTLLLTARGLARQGEVIVRASVGATAGDLTRHVVGEGMVLASIGGALGLVLAAWCIAALEGVAGGALVGVRPMEMDARILLAGMGMAAVLGVISSLVPALVLGRGKGIPVDAGIRWTAGGPRRAERLGPLVVGIEMALALALAVGAGATLENLRTGTTEALGVRGDDLLVVTVPLPVDRFQTTARRVEIAEALQGAVASVPGAFAVGVTEALPSDDDQAARPVVVEDQPADATGVEHRTRVRAVSHDYFYAVGQRLAAGRGFQPRDDASGAPVAVVDGEAARRLFSRPSIDPVGSRISLDDGPGRTWRTVVGVVESAPGEGAGVGPVIYVPLAQDPPLRPTVVARMDVDPAAGVEAARAAVYDLDPTLAVSRVAPWSSLVDEALAGDRLASFLSSAVALLALLLSMIGVHGLVAHDVSTRLRELALRKAVGATGADLRYRILRTVAGIGGAGVLAGGAVAGLLLNAGPGRPMPLPDSPLVWAGAVTALAVAVGAGVLHPLRRSASVDAMAALGRE